MWRTGRTAPPRVAYFPTDGKELDGDDSVSVQTFPAGLASAVEVAVPNWCNLEKSPGCVQRDQRGSLNSSRTISSKLEHDARTPGTAC